MLDLAISIGADSRNGTVIETNGGVRLRALNWPQDRDFQMVAFGPDGEAREVIGTEDLAEDIGRALFALDRAAVIKGRKPAWYRRLEQCASAASSTDQT